MSETPVDGDGVNPLRLLEALLFAAREPLDRRELQARLPKGQDVDALLAELELAYRNRGVTLVRLGQGWMMRTAPDLAPWLRIETTVPRRPTRAAAETLAIIAFHQPVTRAEVEEIRGVALSQGTMEQLIEAGWIRPGRRRQTPGRPVTWVTTEGFLAHFGLHSLDDLPGVEELRASGLLDPRPALRALQGGDGDRDGDTELGSTGDEGVSEADIRAETPGARTARREQEDVPLLVPAAPLDDGLPGDTGAKDGRKE